MIDTSAFQMEATIMLVDFRPETHGLSSVRLVFRLDDITPAVVVQEIHRGRDRARAICVTPEARPFFDDLLTTVQTLGRHNDRERSQP